VCVCVCVCVCACVYVCVCVCMCGYESRPRQTTHMNEFYHICKQVMSHMWTSHVTPANSTTGWRRLIGCLKLQVISRKRATNCRALLHKMTYEDKASYGSSPPCTRTVLFWGRGLLSPMNHVRIFKGWPLQDAPSKLVRLWYKSFPPGRFLPCGNEEAHHVE